MSNTVEWTAESGVNYLVLITLSEFSASTTIRDFELQIIGNEQFCEGAQPIVPGDADVVASVENATKQDVVFCEDVAQTTSSEPGVWYKVSGVRACAFLYYFDRSACSLFSLSPIIRST